MPSAHTARQYRILRFIRRKPMPAKILGETLAGEEVKVAVSGDTAANLADTVSALGDCWTLKAVDRENNLIRRLDLDPHDPELGGEEEEKAPRPGALISIDVPKLVDNIARNMREVASSSASQQANAFKEGFAAMTSVVNLCLSLLVRVERRLEEVETQAIGSAPTDDRQQLAMMAIQKAFGGPTNGGAPGFHISPEMIQSLVAQLGSQGQGDDHGSG